MTIHSSVPVQAGQLRGRGFWSSELQSFAVDLDVFDPGSVYPPATVRIGTRCAEFVTVDALINHLVATGLAPDGESLALLYRLGQLVVDVVGAAELVGCTDDRRHRHLYVLTPNGTLLGVNPRLDHIDYRLHWGDAGSATIETARLLCDVAFVRRPGQDGEAFALALTHEFLAGAGDDFSVGAVALADWFLTDSVLSTALGEDEIAEIRRRVGSVRRPDPAGRWG